VTLGGIRYQYLSHRHEASDACNWLSAQFSAELFCHAEEKEAISKVCAVDGTFTGDGQLHEDRYAIETPGHCKGSTGFLWVDAGMRVLFAGDTLYLADGRLGVFTSGHQREAMISSLRKLANLEFDLLLPGLHVGDEWNREFTASEFRLEVEEVVERLMHGEIH
jgi:glyoxylase-like metal-dependent hydrolase (beta-lactamase superfamily II)